jgi:PTH1 family peptidyl-tRNA hydrolase
MPLIVGLGNPGAEYDHTPHNVGFDIAARLVKRANVKFRRSRVGEAEEAVLPGSDKVVIFRPLSFMNLSGRPVSAALHWHHFTKKDLLVICDDVNLPFGHLRIRDRGGSGGQKGMRSIIESLGTEEFARLRIGVGGGHAGADVARHVLSKFSLSRRAVMEPVLELAADAVECYLRDGLETAMNRFNTQRQAENTDNPSGENRSPDESSPKGEA